jgi:hypothetical protein
MKSSIRVAGGNLHGLKPMLDIEVSTDTDEQAIDDMS